MVYLDVLLLTNFLTAYLLLLAAGALSGQRAPFARMLAGSALAALSALILFAPEQPYPVQVAYKAATALGITAAAFGWRSRRRLVTAACWYAALNIALAGAVLLVILRTGTRVADTANLTVYLRVSPLLLLALSGACCAAVELGLRLFTRREAPTKTAGLELELCGQPVRLRAALDTGALRHGGRKEPAARLCSAGHWADHRKRRAGAGAQRRGVCAAQLWQHRLRGTVRKRFYVRG